MAEAPASAEEAFGSAVCLAGQTDMRARFNQMPRGLLGNAPRIGASVPGTVVSDGGRFGVGLVMHFDGACEPTNPGGLGSWGWLLTAGGDLLASDSGTIPPGPASTNNVAEYTALGKGLRHAADDAGGLPPGALLVRGDSQLVVRQVTGQWLCNRPHLARLRDRCRELLAVIGRTRPVRLEWVRREENESADALTVAAWERATGKPFPRRVRP